MKFIKTYEDYGGGGYKNITPIKRKFDKITKPNGTKRDFTDEEREFLIKYYVDHSWVKPDNDGIIILGGGRGHYGKHYITEDDLKDMIKKDKETSKLPKKFK